MALHRKRLLPLAAAYAGIALTAALLSCKPSAPANTASTKPATPESPDPSLQAHFHERIQPLLQHYCLECHNDKDKVADLSLQAYTTAADVIDHRDKWELISKYIRTQQMPPDLHPALTDTERTELSTWVDGQLYAYYKAHPDPGRITIRRLNKNEYDNTIRDLVGIDFQPSADFPQDDSGYGFDNIGDVLSLPPVLMEKYLAAADKILDEAIATEAPASTVRHISTSQAQIGFNARGDRGDGWAKLISLEEDDFATEQRLPAGDYIVRVKAFSEPTGGGLVGQGSDVPLKYDGPVPVTNLGIFVGDTFVQDLPIDAREDNPKIYEARIGIPAGKTRIAAAVRRNRGFVGGNDNETYMLNGRIGTQQPGIVYVKYLEIEGPLPQAIQRFPARTLKTTGSGLFTPQNAWTMQAAGSARASFTLPKEQDVILRAQVCAQQAGKEPVKMEFHAAGRTVASFDVLAPATLEPLPRQRLFDINLLKARPYVYEARVKLPTGPVDFDAAFVNPLQDPQNTNPNLRQRTLTLDYLEVVQTAEPLPPPPMPQPLTALFDQVKGKGGGAGGAAAERDKARTIVAALMYRAFRRPVQNAEVDRFMQLYDLAAKNGEPFASCVKLPLKAILVSPHFLFLGDISAATVSAQPAETKMHPVDEFTLASRLSYFLWSSAPDEELLTLASKNQLRANLKAQVTRMLASPKSQAFVSNFAGQWLQLRNLPNLAPDKTMFADFDDSLRRDMGRETELLFDAILHQNRSVMEFLTADYTFLNGRLARFYGITGVQGQDFQRVSLADTPRRGILTQASILTLTSNPTRTSPVKRGKFVLESLMGTPPPPPPPDVPKLEDQHTLTGSLRQQMEAHRANPVCASCHAQMDPIGFGLENFDAVGKWRDKDGSAAVDAAGALKTGEQFANAAELSQILAGKRKDDFVHCLTEKMLTYALGRGVEPFDRPAVEDIVHATESDDCRFDTLIQSITQSLPFQMERSPGEK